VAAVTTTVLTIGYEGSAFHGFARQDGPVSVQGTLEDALFVALRRPVQTVGAGRTDTGVHARAQVVSFESAEGDANADALMRSLNALAGPHIVVSDIRSAREGFSARHDALAREYRYLVVPGPVPPLALRGRAWWVKGDLDLEAMRTGANVLIGEHDFKSFCVAESAQGKRTVRDISVLEIGATEQLGEACIEIRIVGRSFLHSMVRIVVGTLVEVGKGRRAPEWVAEALGACDRAAAGPTAPPEGLTLWSVEYPSDVWA
jgi:tRNA pseudouridine38-40 synthase